MAESGHVTPASTRGQPPTAGAVLDTGKTSTSKFYVADGDSITFGYGATDEGSRSYPGVLRYGCPTSYVNMGVSGSRLLGPGLGAPVPAMLDTAAFRLDPLVQPGAVLTLMAGTNDIAENATSAQIDAALDRYCSERTAAGWHVYILTILGRSSTGYTAAQETVRKAVNAHIVAMTTCTPIDVAADPMLQPTNTMMFLWDGTHLVDAGYYQLATDVAQALGLPVPAHY